MENEKLDGKMRGFMIVERFHLNRLWAYKAIRQQIQILSDRLMRITKEYDKLIEELGDSRQQRQSDRADGDERLLNSDSDEQVPSLRGEDKGAQDPKQLKLKQ